MATGTRRQARWPAQVPDLAIETALTLRLDCHFPLRQAEGFLRSLFEDMGIDLSAPDHTTLSRRSQHLDVRLRRVIAGGPLHLIVDSTGLSIVGEGEWAAARHGGKGARGWKKLHLGVDQAGAIVAQVLTGGNTDDAKTGIYLVNVVGENVTSFTADAAYDTTAINEAARSKESEGCNATEQNSTRVPFGCGYLCVGGIVQRLRPTGFSNPLGEFDRMVGFTSPPTGGGPSAITGGSTWSFDIRPVHVPDSYLADALALTGFSSPVFTEFLEAHAVGP